MVSSEHSLLFSATLYLAVNSVHSPPQRFHFSIFYYHVNSKVPSKKQKNLDRYHAALDARVGLNDSIQKLFKNKGLLLKLLAFIIMIYKYFCFGARRT